MITIKNKNLTTETINQINELVDMDINASCAFKLARMVKDLAVIVEDRVAAERKIFDKYAEKEEDGSYSKVYDENNQVVNDAIKILDLEKFHKEMDDLMDVDNKLNHDQIKFDELGLKTAKIKNLINLDFLFI